MPSVPLGALNQLVPLADGIIAAANATAASARKLQRARRPSLRYTALRPGSDTPLWNELAAAVSRSFHRRGEKTRLARLLGISRQRLHLLIVAKDACADAERTLQLLVWLQARRRGVDLT
jgi:hypothetical protein